MFKRKLGLIVGACLAALSFAAVAVDSKDDLNTGVSGSFGCFGFHNNTDNTAVSLRNYSETATVNITRIRLFDANAVLVFDSSVSALPATFKSTLTAHQSASITTTDMAGTSSPLNPMQIHIDWASADGSRVLPPLPAWGRFSAGYNGVCRMTSLVTRLPQ